MRKPDYISPSSLSIFEKDRVAFYTKYMAEPRTPKDPQTDAQSVGSSFDAFVKANLSEALFGIGAKPELEFETLFESQVEEPIRDFAFAAGLHVFEAYCRTGAYQELLIELQVADGEPQFEFSLNGTVGGVPLMGKPDCRYIHASGAHVMLDWKVNGYCSKYAYSPNKFYAMVRDGQEGKRSRNAGNPHKGYKPIFFQGLTIGKHFLEEANSSWADQLSIYGWMMGEDVGTENMVARIDQIVCKPDTPPILRVANHRARVSSQWQLGLVKRLQSCWTAIERGWIFTDLTKAESKARCEAIDMLAQYNKEVADGEG